MGAGVEHATLPVANIVMVNPASTNAAHGDASAGFSATLSTVGGSQPPLGRVDTRPSVSQGNATPRGHYGAAPLPNTGTVGPGRASQSGPLWSCSFAEYWHCWTR